MMLRRRGPRLTEGRSNEPASSGPRWTRAAAMRPRSCRSGEPAKPKIPHMRGDSPGVIDRPARRLCRPPHRYTLSQARSRAGVPGSGAEDHPVLGVGHAVVVLAQQRERADDGIAAVQEVTARAAEVPVVLKRHRRSRAARARAARARQLAESRAGAAVMHAFLV